MNEMTQTLINVAVDSEVMRRAERVAALRRTTVAEMLAVALQTIGDMDFDLDSLPPLTRSAVGLARGVPDRPYKELLVDALIEKYGLDA